jgi:4-amino-4-deoxy-L-arabinose transferase-like glycosyltransferase
LREPRIARLLPPALTLLILAVPRLVALQSDAYARLDWSAGLLTDEGFYAHNARNLALFGEARTDDFNNMLVSPLLHLAQSVVFGLLGFGLAQARLISVVCSLLLLLLLFDALRRHFGRAIAATAVLFVGLDHTSLLYHRMALMDTPAALFAVAALWAFARGLEARRAGSTAKWMAGCGICVGLGAVIRSLALYVALVPLLTMLPRRDGASRPGLRGFAWAAMGLGLVVIVYLLSWYLPHRAELDAMNHYYRAHQLQPRSLHHLGMNIYHALLGDHRGIAPYLFRHAPVLFGLALLLFAGSLVGAPVAQSERERLMLTYLGWWAVLGLALLSVIAYSPSRYYVTLYPALYSLAAVALWRLPTLAESLCSDRWRARLARAAVIWLISYHAIQSVLHRGGVLPPAETLILLYGVPTLLALGAGCSIPRLRAAAWACPLGLALWTATNGYWLADWVRHIDYSQMQLSRRLHEVLPEGSVMLGDVAPGMAWANRHLAINVIPGLCNDRKPVERFAGRPRYIVILDGRWKERWWMQNYPDLVRPERRVLSQRALRWLIGVYAVD